MLLMHPGPTGLGLPKLGPWPSLRLCWGSRNPQGQGVGLVPCHFPRVWEAVPMERPARMALVPRPCSRPVMLPSPLAWQLLRFSPRGVGALSP